MCKKLGSFLLSFSLIISPIVAKEAEDYDSGKIKVEQIMSHEETGVAAYNKKHINYAETQNIASDLNIVEIAKFFNCKTVIGQAFIAETLQCPVTPRDRDSVLARRQHIIKTLVENEALREQIGQLLEKAKQEEQEVIKLMSEFFRGQTCPELKQLEEIKKQNPWLAPVAEFLILNPTGKTIGTAIGLLNEAATLSATAYVGYITYLLAKAGADYKGLAAYTGMLGVFSGVGGYTLYKDYQYGSDKRTKLHALNQLITVAENFEELCAEHGMESQFKVSDIKDANGVRLVQKLKHARYRDKNIYLFMVPFVHTFLYQVYREEKHLAEVLACIAEMDAYHAIATKIVESQSSGNNKFCFVNFIDDAKPQIQGQSFWNVLVENAVPSSITEDRHVILTGPNAGGKTTAIRAMLQNIVLGQCFGVAAAEKFEFTMFDVIHSYLNISDDLLNGLSLFASEIKRAQEVLQRIKSLEPEKKFFFALDELFTGTNAEDGEICAYEFVKRIADFSGVQFIYATHFDKLKELGESHALCVNYKVDAPTKDANGKLVFPFTISQGANQARVALDLARQAQLFA